MYQSSTCVSQMIGCCIQPRERCAPVQRLYKVAIAAANAVLEPSYSRAYL